MNRAPASADALATSAVPWYRTITAEQWRVLIAAKLGWMLDAMDFMLYAMAIGQLRTYFGFDDRTAGMLGTVTLVMSGAGGVLFGYVADRLGRTRALMGTILLFSLASLGASTSQSVVQLLLWRALLGIGMGGEWASGAVLISETWPAAHRNKAISIMQSGWAIGYLIAALVAALVLGAPEAGPDAWRWLFLVGMLPALFTLWIRRHVREPDVWLARGAAEARERNPFGVMFGRRLIVRTLLIILLGASVQFAYWGIFFWLPAFLARPVAQGGAGMGVVGSLGWIVPVQIGAYFGYLTFGFIADRLGRRPTFILFMLAAALLVPVYGQMGRNPAVLMLLGPVLGYFGHGYFSLFGSFIAELFPTAVRATAQGTSYNIGRMAGALAPFTIGAVATLPGIGIGLALATTSAFFLLGAALIVTLPDRSGQELEA
ncbi:MAG: MFS transporter [Acidobacteria bacterium RIFCSPLOWO2_02_FULL_68_18]|nr:MAG: MFS transporter [Acidobacteria bacterium RIFCSPLOWO2_02_FULL_68_18]OFW50604.1 MAG: MFS transporter [Acidobacteria bacterium RIFCSPLOWO2_12_FULL_68_19]